MELFESVMSSNAAGRQALGRHRGAGARCQLPGRCATAARDAARRALFSRAPAQRRAADTPPPRRLRQPLRVVLLPERGAWLSLPPRLAAVLLDGGAELPLIAQLLPVDATGAPAASACLLCSLHTPTA